jgi:site-specific DNA recombinase
MGSGDALIYCRVSTKGQEEEGTSLDSQESACVQHVESLGYSVGRVTREVYTGSELWDRPKLSRDRADIKAGRFAALVFYSLERLSRDPIHIALIAEECERVGCDLICVAEPLDSSDEGELVRYVKGYAGKIERARIRERHLRGKHQRAVSGKIHRAGLELYGYRRDKDASVRYIFEPEAAIIRDIFSRIVSGNSYLSVAKYLNSRGPEVAPAPGQSRHPDRCVKWTANSVYRIIHNPDCKGEAQAWKWQWQPKQNGKGRTLTRRAPEDRIAMPAGVVPPIVTPELWQRAHDAVSAQSGDRTRNEKTPFLLRGRVYCGVCGHKYYPSWQISSGHNAKKIRGYRCSSDNNIIRPGSCGARKVNAARIEASVWSKIAEVIKRPDIIAQEWESRQQQGPDSSVLSDIETAKKRIALCERKQARMIDEYTGLESDDDESLWALVKRNVKKLDGEIAKWRKVVAEGERHIAQQGAVIGQREAILAYCEHVASHLDHMSFEEQVLALEMFAIRVTVLGPDHWHVKGLIQFEELRGVVIVRGDTSAQDVVSLTP